MAEDKLANAPTECPGINCPKYTYRCIAYGEPSVDCPLPGLKKLDSPELKGKKLYHINWGDGDNTYVWANSKEEAIARMPDGKDMVNFALDITSVIEPRIKDAKKQGATDKCRSCRHTYNPESEDRYHVGN